MLLWGMGTTEPSSPCLTPPKLRGSQGSPKYSFAVWQDLYKCLGLLPDVQGLSLQQRDEADPPHRNLMESKGQIFFTQRMEELGGSGEQMLDPMAVLLVPS